MDEWLFMHNQWASPTGWDLISCARPQGTGRRSGNNIKTSLRLRSWLKHRTVHECIIPLHTAALCCPHRNIPHRSNRCRFTFFIMKMLQARSCIYVKPVTALSVGSLWVFSAVCRFVSSCLQSLLNKLADGLQGKAGVPACFLTRGNLTSPPWRLCRTPEPHCGWDCDWFINRAAPLKHLALNWAACNGA